MMMINVTDFELLHYDVPKHMSVPACARMRRVCVRLIINTGFSFGCRYVEHSL